MNLDFMKKRKTEQNSNSSLSETRHMALTKPVKRKGEETTLWLMAVAKGSVCIRK